MNVIRFNEPFEHAIATWPYAVEPMMPFTKWQRTPLFQYFTERSKQKGMIDAMLASGERIESCHWPFETFRLSLAQHSEEKWFDEGREWGDGQYRVDAIVTRKSERVHLLANIIRLYDETSSTLGQARRYNPLIVYLADCYTTIDNPNTYAFRSNTFASGRWLNSNISKPLVEGAMDALAGFVCDSMVPTNHIAEVRPDQPGRSVEWVHARTHYTLITHGHPANKKSVRDGQRVAVDTDKELTRMAHDRKGYYKTLKHPRYRFALNEKRYANYPKGTIKVKPCWVGPKEWRDEGGRQIYKILEPVRDELTENKVLTASV
jgi:hypothetical protein